MVGVGNGWGGGGTLRDSLFVFTISTYTGNW